LPNRPAPNVGKLEVAIIGAGVIGLAIAWRLAARLREQAGHMTASDFCAARYIFSCQAGAIHT